MRGGSGDTVTDTQGIGLIGQADTTGQRSAIDVSVVLATHLGENRITRALESLVRQTLAPDRFEVVMVLNGPPCGTDVLVAAFRERHPAHQLRLVTTSQAGASNARNIGVMSARGTHLTFMDDDDYLSPEYLDVLLSGAEHGVVPVAFIADVTEGEEIEQLAGVPSNYVNDKLLPFAGQTVPAEAVATILSPNVAKLVPTSVARAVAYSSSLRSGEDFVYWTQIYALTRFMARVPETSSNAFYFRTVRDGSVSRQVPTYDFLVTQRLDCIEELSRIPEGDPVVDRVVRGKMATQAQQIGAFLRENPKRRAEIVAEVRRRDLSRFPYKELARGSARDLALLYCFAPYQDTSALVASRRIREQGDVVDVITNRLDKVRQIDDWSLEITEGYVDQLRTVRTPQYMGAWGAIRQFVEAALGEIADLETNKGPYRSVYSRAMWPASHFAAAAYKIFNRRTHWRAEFSDPMLHDIKGQVRQNLVEDDELIRILKDAVLSSGHCLPESDNMWEWVEWIAYALADEIVFTNENQRDYMLNYCSDSDLSRRALSVSRVAHHPTLPAAFYQRKLSDYRLDPDVKNIAYFGVFYATRGIAEVTEAMQHLSATERSAIHLHIFTDKPAECEAELLAHGLGESITVNPFVPFLEFLNLTTRFDVLLVNDAATTEHHPINPYLPSKLSDYRGSGRMIWSIVEPGSVLSRVPTALQSELGDVDGARRVLGEIARLDTGVSSAHRDAASERARV